jgi:hypothetical protein
MAASPFARLLDADARDADNVVVIARRPVRGAHRRRRAAEGAGTRLLLHYAATRPERGNRACKSVTFAGISMELAGLEWATFWVRSSGSTT